MSSPIMKYFAYEHLPPKLQEVSKAIGELAKQMDSLFDGAEKSAGLRKLLEAKDCFVRALLPMLFIALLLCASSADACERCGLFGNRCAFRQVQAVHVQQLVAAPIVYPQISYFVGAPIRVEAIVQKALREDPGYAEYQKFKAWQQSQAGASQPTAPLNKPTESIPASLLASRCSQCHSGDSPKGGLLLDGTAELTCDQALRAMKMIQSGKMPPKNKLTPEDAGGVFQDLLDLVKSK